MRKHFFLLVFSFFTAFAGDSLVFVIRVDDIQSRNVSYAPGLFPFQRTVEFRGGKVTWAVIPHRLIESMNNQGFVTGQLLTTRADGHEISLHGYNHTCLRCGSTGHEYYCATQGYNHPYAVQSAMTDTSLKILNDSLGLRPVSFVPPGHHADTISWRMLVDQGFDIVSTTGTTKQFKYPGLYNLAPHQEFTWSMQPADYRTQMTNALKDIRTKGAVDGYYMLLLHDPFTRPGYQNGLVVTWIGELLDSLNIEYAGKIRYRTLTEAARAFRDAPSHLAGEPEGVPDGFILKQNFPNPFNPSTVIEFSTPSGGNASLKVYDVLGREVATLLDGLVDAGSHSLRFDANGLGSGIYFYRLTINGSTLSRKMQLSK